MAGGTNNVLSRSAIMAGGSPITAGGFSIRTHAGNAKETRGCAIIQRLDRSNDVVDD